MSSKSDKAQSDWRRDNHIQHQNNQSRKHPVPVQSTVVRKPNR